MWHNFINYYKLISFVITLWPSPQLALCFINRDAFNVTLITCVTLCLRSGLGFSFIHSGHFYSTPSKSTTTQRRSRLQHGYCIGVSRRSAQATAGKGLAQGPYVVARAGVEPTTLRLKAIDSTKAPARPTLLSCISCCGFFLQSIYSIPGKICRNTIQQRRWTGWRKNFKLSTRKGKY